MKDSEFVYKYEIAIILNINIKTLARLLNDKYFEQLAELGYEKKQRYLNPLQLNWLKKKLDFITQEK